MLPSSGYFKNLICPYFEQDNCDRVYCHFKHKKANIIINYTPTPVHLLQKSQIESKSSTPEYKPTPINKLKPSKIDEKTIVGKSINKDEAKNSSLKDKKNGDSSKVTTKKSNLFENIESTLSSIFDEETDEEIIEIDNDKKDKTKSDSNKEAFKKSKRTDCSYIEELNRNSKETKAKRDQRDKEIVKAKSKPKDVPNDMISEIEQLSNPVLKKTRIAHKIANNSHPVVQQPKKITRLTPAQAMFNRFTNLQSGDQAKSKKSETVSSPNSSKKQRIAHIPAIAKQSPTSDGSSKPLPKRPVLPLELGGKVPNTIRQRYLNLIIDECLKLIQGQEEAYERALEEEKNIFKRSPSKSTYMNLAVNAIKRLRDANKAKDP